MTNPQTEARAIYERGINAGQLYSVVNEIATALAAKDAELAAQLRATQDAWNERDGEKRLRLRAEAQLAEARKALEPFAAVADTEDEVGREDPEDDRVWVVQAHGCQIGDLTVEHFHAARRALAEPPSSKYALSDTEQAEPVIPPSVSDDELAQWADKRADDAGRLARELIAYRRASILHGPFGWLNGHRALSEDIWALESDPLANDDEYFSIPLYAMTDPFKETGKSAGIAAPEPDQREAVAMRLLRIAC